MTTTSTRPATLQTEPLFGSLGLAITSPDARDIMELDVNEVIEQFKKSGLLLFRGFNVDSQKFEQFTNQFSNDYMNYAGGGYVRRTINDKSDGTILSVNYYLKGDDEQSTFELPMHGEMYYIKHRPMIMWFCCAVPAEQDGETTVADGAEILRELKPATRAAFEAQPLKYIRHYPKADWQGRYQTTDIADVQAYCDFNGLSLKYNPDDESIHTEFVYPAIIKSRWGGHEAFINNVLPVVWQEEHGLENSIVRFADGSVIPPEAIQDAKDTVQRVRRKIPWKSGEVAVVDNTRILHGRMSFTDQRRQIYSRMCRSVQW